MPYSGFCPGVEGGDGGRTGCKWMQLLRYVGDVFIK